MVHEHPAATGLGRRQPAPGDWPGPCTSHSSQAWESEQIEGNPPHPEQSRGRTLLYQADKGPDIYLLPISNPRDRAEPAINCRAQGCPRESAWLDRAQEIDGQPLKTRGE